MTSNILPYASKEQFDDLGVMGRIQSAAAVTFDAARVDEDYAGNEQREDAEREAQAYVDISGRPGHPLGNKFASASMTGAERATALAAQFERALAAGDNSSIRFFNELARTGRDKLAQAVEIDGRTGRRKDYEIREVLLDTGKVKNAQRAADKAEEIVSKADAAGSSRTSDTDFTVVADTVEEAKVLRAAIDYALKILPPGADLKSQTLVTNVGQLPTVAAFSAALRAAAPPVWGWAHQAVGKNQGAKTLAVIASHRDEAKSAAAVAAYPKDISVIPASGPVGKALREAGDKHWRIQFSSPSTGNSPFDWRAHFERVMNASDRVCVVWNGDVKDNALHAAVFAAKRGKLDALVLPDGTRLTGIEAQAEALLAGKSRGMNAASFDIPASSPHGRLALSLIHPLSGPGLLPETIDALGSTGMTINDLVAAASEPTTAMALVKEYKIPLGAMRILASEGAVNAGRGSYERIAGHCAAHGVSVVGPEDYPLGMLANSKRLPAVMFLKGGSAEQLRGLENVVAVLGDRPLPEMTEKGAALVRGLDARADTVLLQVEKSGLPEFVPSKPSLLVLASGHAHYGPVPNLGWSEGQDGAPKAKAETSHGAYAISDDAETRTHRLIFTPAGGSPSEIGSAPMLFEKVEKRLAANTGFEPISEDDERAVKQHEAALNGLRSRAATHEASLLAAPTKAYRDAIVEKGGMILSHLPPEEVSSKWDRELQARIPSPASRNPGTEARAIETAARIADAVAIVQLGTQSPILAAVVASAETGRRVAVVSPSAAIATYDEIGGNRALTRLKGAELPQVLNLPGENGHTVSKGWGTRRGGVSLGEDGAAGAAIVAKVAAENRAGPLDPAAKAKDGKDDGQR